MFLRIFKHLLPRAKAWQITVEKQLRQFFEGLSGLGSDVKNYYDLIYLDLFPQKTRQLSEYEDQFGLLDSGLTEQERRDRLDTRWQDAGGQSPRYLQDILQAYGFDVYVHEWWEPGTEPAVGVKACVTPRDPRLYIGDDDQISIGGEVFCGEPLAQCGEPTAQMAPIVENGYLLVNKVLQTTPDIKVTLGNPEFRLGNTDIRLGAYDNFKTEPLEYVIPTDQNKWRYFLYIGGETFGSIASVALSRREEFEDLCLRKRPAQNWLGMLIRYI